MDVIIVDNMIGKSIEQIYNINYNNLVNIFGVDVLIANAPVEIQIHFPNQGEVYLYSLKIVRPGCKSYSMSYQGLFPDEWYSGIDFRVDFVKEYVYTDRHKSDSFVLTGAAERFPNIWFGSDLQDILVSDYNLRVFDS